MSEEFVVDHERAAMATEMFLHFCAATTMKQIRGLYWNMLDTIGLRPGPLNEFYPKLKATIRDWRAQALFKKFDARAAHKVYSKGKAATNTRVLIVGAGPCGLRTAIDAQLLGAKVVVVEKRDRISRNNVLHLWPFIIHDLKALGAKKFYGKFCAGSIDHISIRQLQCILLKVALLLGVEMHEGVSFVKEIEPGDGCGWRASVSPEDHAVSHYEFDVLIGADGKRNTLEGFQRKEFRGKLAIAITANFINKRTEAEAMVEEISGVAFIFDQPFFKALYEKTGCDLENIVYYKDDTHYFVMTAKKHSLLHRGVIIKDLSDPAELLAPSNVDKPKLYEYARDAANFATKYQMPNLEFAVNHYGTPDVAVFDFTSIFAAHNSCKVTVRKNYRLLSCLVGDSLLEPFWPTGSGCARGFLSSMDAAYAIKLFANPKNSLLATIAQRESVYRLLGQTTPENLNRAFGAYTLDPSTRYQNLNKSSVQIAQVKHLLDTDDPVLLEQTFFDSNAIASSVTPATELPVKRKRRTIDVVPLGATLLRWLKGQLKDSGFVQELNEPTECFTNGKVLCTLIHRYRPDLVNLEELTDFSADVCNEHAFNIFENQLGIPRVMSGQESVTLSGVDPKVWLNYLEQICDVFRGEIPHVKHIKLDYAEFKQKQESNVDAWAKLGRMAAVQRMAAIASGVRPGENDLGSKDVIPTAAASSASFGPRGNAKNYYHPNAEEERYKRGHGGVASPQNDTMRRMRKRRSNEKSGNIEERTRRLQEIEANRLDRQSKRREQRAQQTQNFYKSIHMLQANTLLRESDNAGAFDDYSLYLYRQSAPQFNDRVRELELKLRYPDRDRGLAAAYPRGLNDGDQFSDRVRSMEQRIDGKTVPVVEKKPKDLLRAIGKIDSSDWNVKEIERKIEQSKKTTDIGKSRERVPNWNREQFLARQNRLMQPQDDEKYKEIDSSLKAIDKQLKEGHNLDLGERGKNKVALIAGQLQTSKQAQAKQSQQQQQQQPPSVQQQQQQQKSNQKALVLTTSGVAEKCHFCKQRVYLMEKISAEGLTLHRSCLKCHHCHTILRLGSYAFDRDDTEGRFYCTQHFKLPAKTLKPASRKSQAKSRVSGPVIGRVYDASDAGVRVGTVGTSSIPAELGSSTVDYLARTRTPDNDDSDGEVNMEVIDENEWTDRNFGTESEVSEAELSSSDESDTDSESDYEETAGSPLGAQTLQLASEWISDKRFSNMVDSDADFYSYSSEDDDADSQTEGEELARAREMRRQEVKLMPPPTLPTDTETEGATDSEVNSTEISTDSEFDDEQPQRVPPSFHLEFKPLVEVDPTIKLVQNRAPLAVPRPGDYVLSKTASTEGIASKKSLELKKKYLLGEGTTGLGILKSGSASALDSKFKSFHSNITECQKLLNPAAQISPTMQTFLKNSTTNPPSAGGNRTREESSTVPAPPTLPSESVNDTEKENVYEGKRTGTGNVNGSSSALALGANKRSSLVETINTTLVENKLNEIKSNESFAGKEEQKSEQQQQPTGTDQQQARSQNSSPISKTKQPQAEHDGVGNGHIDHTAKLKNSLNNNNNNNKRNNNNNNNNGEEVLEIIDLVTPEKVNDATHRDTAANETGGLVEHKYITNLKHTYIDLTTDSPNCDRSLVETTLDFSIAPSKLGNERPTNSSAVPDIISNIRIDSNENKIEQHAANTNGVVKQKLLVGKTSNTPPEQQAQQQQGEDGCHETTLQVPLDVPWTKEEEIESDSISESGSNSSEISSSSSSSSSSSTSSVEDIPHFILDSTTSPETQNDERFVPRLEVRDATGELMQIDSLMIIDGRYIGDPEDLKLMEKLPPDTQIAAQMLQAEINQDSINTVLEGESALPSCGAPDEEGKRMDQPDENTAVQTKSDTEEGECASTPTPLPMKADPVSSLSNFVSQRNPCFKFDSRNENKIDTLKNLPFVLDADQRTSLQKSMHLNLNPHNAPPVDVETDTEQTPMAGEVPGGTLLASPTVPPYTKRGAPDADSDSQDDTEVTTQNNLTETELSDWAADDAVSENFVDLEFALNSNKGTIRRNHKPKHPRLQHKKLPSSSNGGDGAAMVRSVPASYTAASMQPRNGITATEDGIIRNLALEDIEFMDTGSEEESCIETYSTTNRMMLKNRGYMEIMDPTVESKRAVYPPLSHAYGTGQPKLVEAINNQIAGRPQMDYIEQGSYLLANDDAKTPMNEEPLGKITFSTLASQNIKLGEQVCSVECAPDIEEDSLLLISSSQGTAPGTTTNSTATNDESDALTMVVAAPSTATGHEPDPANPNAGSTSGRGSATSYSSSLHCGGAINSNGHSSTAADRTPDPELAAKSNSRSRDESPARKISVESLSGKRSSLERKDVRKDSLKGIEDIGYEKYVKRLQQKIQQISNARDSLEVKKGKRKSSKGEMVLTLSEANREGMDEQECDGAASGSTGQQAELFTPDQQQKLGTVSSSAVLEPDTPQPKSVEKKIEEITKERVKQKDLIHDLVMDKLQTKKQLNAEKRLNRSRNRSNVLVGQSSNGGANGAAVESVGDSPTAATAASFRSGGGASLKELERTPLPVSNQSNVYSSVMSMRALPSSAVLSSSACDALKENIGFANGKSAPHPHPDQLLASAAYQQQLITPRNAAGTFGDGEQPLTTEQLREEARSRARLKSNQDLGLSPEDRLLLLRKKYHITMRGLTDDDDVDAIDPNKSDDAKCKDQARTKLITSKSVNDVSMLKQQQQQSLSSLHHHHHHHHHHHQPGLLVTSTSSIAKVDPSVSAGELQHSTPKKLTDYISDPNLMHTSTIEQDTGSEVRLRTRGKRGKDRERRKSIIEKVSEFFNGRKKTENGGSKESSPTKDRPTLLTANGGPSDSVPGAGSSTSGGGGFLRFKISPKLKDKSKTKESSPYGRCASDDCLNSNVPNGLPTTTANVSPVAAAGVDMNAVYVHHNSYTPIGRKEAEELEPPPIPPLPLNYERSDDEAGAANESKNEMKKIRAMSKTSRQAELKRLRIAQEIQREQEEIDVKIKDLETRGVEIEKELRGESETLKKGNATNLGANDDGLVKEWLEIMSSITRLKVRDDELSIRQQELQLEHRHAQLKEELNMRLSYGKLDKNSSDVAAEGAILNEMLEIVAKRQALRPSPDTKATAAAVAAVAAGATLSSKPNAPNTTFTARMPKDTDI
ncbi:F-actin-monooxygenase Mical isoform X4 [Anopheles stephensi]|uniref:F-actin-monooxygenase Mical isoform X4 n=1 Tax=Anopheles stephensi TaxID=30069 RepID=UPI001658903A|nr:F-actin-monooxygenase Mical isoform X4 [Anopheles stephensi]